ncbi:MAG TPA: DUF3108 domain-containing protein [Thermoanaerobaculia bacterium]|nr:DUF3108 domain-containing protein [Thermoanaerobaculia bacterium]
MVRPVAPRLARTLLALALLLPLVGAAPAQAEESLDYHWSLKGLLGRLAGVVVPNEGRGQLRSRPDSHNEGGRITELEITSPAAGRGEFFRYGGELRADGTTSQAWSSYRWRGQEKSHRDPVAESGVVDVASGIQLIRARRPTSPLRLRIWSDGRVYPVTVQKAGTERVAVPAGSFLADHYRIRGVRTDGERFWKGGLDLWLAKDEVATPVRIQVERGFANVRLDLLPAGA